MASMPSTSQQAKDRLDSGFDYATDQFGVPPTRVRISQDLYVYLIREFPTTNLADLFGKAWFLEFDVSPDLTGTEAEFRID